MIDILQFTNTGYLTMAKHKNWHGAARKRFLKKMAKTSKK